MQITQEHFALILGVSSGFGEAAALELASAGYSIIGVHLDRQATMHNVERIKKEIEDKGREAIFFNVNAADETKRRDILDELEKRKTGKPKIKVLMHSLAFGTLRPYIPKEGESGMSRAQMEMTLDVMANSLVYWTQDIFLRGMFVNGGRVFAMTSSGSHTIIPYYGAVSAAKAALESHVRQLAYELGPYDISVNAIMAGVTDTPALRKIPGNESMIRVAKAKNPRKRLTTPQDVAKIIMSLSRDEAGWISGSVIHADGGEDIVSYTE